MGYKLQLICLCFGIIQCHSQYTDSNINCNDLSPYYDKINLDEITGTWYGVEKIPHSKGEYTIERSDECFYIDIKGVNVQPTPPVPYPPLTYAPTLSHAYDPVEQYSIRYFVLEWHEGIWKDEYHIKVNTSHKGFWQADIPNGWVDPMYRYFGTVIQVLKASKTHLVLNFCIRLPNPQLFSVILSRYEHQLTPEDLAVIHNVFTTKHLSTSSLKRVCENSSNSIKLSMLTLTLSWFVIRRCR